MCWRGNDVIFDDDSGQSFKGAHRDTKLFQSSEEVTANRDILDTAVSPEFLKLEAEMVDLGLQRFGRHGREKNSVTCERERQSRKGKWSRLAVRESEMPSMSYIPRYTSPF